MTKAPSIRKWWVVRRELDHSRATLLMTASFLLPLLIWSVAAYGPWWKVAHQVVISGESDELQNVYVVGDTLSTGVWEEFQKAIESDNAEVLEARKAGLPLVVSGRQNKKMLRKLFPLAVKNGWLEPSQEIDDEALRETWIMVAQGKLDDAKEGLSEENRAIVKANAELLEKYRPEWPEESLLKLVPQATEQVKRPVYLVPPGAVAVSFWQGLNAVKTQEGKKTLLERYAESWKTIVLGFLLAIAVAVPLGVMAGVYDFVAKLFEPFVNFFSYMPAPAFGVVLMAIFGLDFGPKIMLVFLGTLPSAILMISKTTRGLDGALIEAAQTLGANQRQLVFAVVVPGILPLLYKDLRLLFGMAWTWLVIAELLGFKSGLSEVIDTHGRRFQFDIVYPAILLIGLSGFFMDQLLGSLERIFFPWVVQTKGGIFRQIFGLRMGRVGKGGDV